MLVLTASRGAQGAQVLLGWDLPTENEDGTPLEDLAGVRIHYGTASGDYTHMIDLPGAATNCSVTGLTENVTYYFAASVYNSAVVESVLCSQLVWTSQDVTPPVIEGPTETLLHATPGGTQLPDLTLTLTITDNVSSEQDIVVTQSPPAGTIVSPDEVTTVTVTATDEAGNSSTHTIAVSVNAVPVVDAGPDQSIRLPVNTVALDGTVSDDSLPPPGSLTLTWSKVSGPGTVEFDDPNAADTQAAFSEFGTYVIRLTASDGVLTAADEVTVRVERARPNPPSNLRLVGT